MQLKLNLLGCVAQKTIEHLVVTLLVLARILQVHFPQFLEGDLLDYPETSSFFVSTQIQSAFSGLHL